MRANKIIRFIGWIFKGYDKRHVRVLGLIVAAAFSARKLGVGVLGRHLETDTAPKHAIKRVDRFLSSKAFSTEDAYRNIVEVVVGSRKFVPIAVDWTKIRELPALIAGVISRGRAIPIASQVMDPQRVYKSYNAFEKGFFTWVKSLLPLDISGVVLLDRGFKRVELTKWFRKVGLHFVVRQGGNVHIDSKRYKGAIGGLIKRRGESVDILDGKVRGYKPVEVRVIGYWDKGQKEPWILVTDLDLPLMEIVRLYGRRFRIEETFRDGKCVRYGLSLRQLKLKKADRLERMLFILALVEWLAMIVGRLAREAGFDRWYRANTERQTHSDFTLGIYYCVKWRWRLGHVKKLASDLVESFNFQGFAQLCYETIQ